MARIFIGRDENQADALACYGDNHLVVTLRNMFGLSHCHGAFCSQGDRSSRDEGADYVVSNPPAGSTVSVMARVPTGLSP